MVRDDDPDLDGDDRDVLEISVDGGEPVNAITDFVGNGAIGLHIHDDAATPGETTLAPLPVLLRAAVPERHRRVHARRRPTPTARSPSTNIPRGDADRPQTLNVPNWPSSGHTMSLVFSDWPVDGAA